MSSEQFRALIQQAKQLSNQERRQLMTYLTEFALAESDATGGTGERPKGATDYVAFFGCGRGAFATAEEADAFIRQERSAWEN